MVRPFKHLILASVAALSVGVAGSLTLAGSASAHSGSGDYRHKDWQASRDWKDEDQTDQTDDQSSDYQQTKADDHKQAYKQDEEQATYHSWKQQDKDTTAKEAKDERSYSQPKEQSYDNQHQQYDNQGEQNAYKQTRQYDNSCDHQQKSEDRSYQPDQKQMDMRQASYRYSRHDDYNYKARDDDQATDNDNEATNQEYKDELAVNLREHAALAGPVLKAELLKEPDLDALMAAADKNNMAIADAVEQGYPGTHDEFLAQWQNHINYYIDYLHGAKDQQEAQKMQAKQNLNDFVENVTMLLGNVSDKLDQEALQQSMTEHGEQTTTFIDNLVAGNYPAAYTVAHEAYIHMGEIAAVLAAGAGKV